MQRATLSLPTLLLAFAFPVVLGAQETPADAPLTATAELRAPDGGVVGMAHLEETPFSGVLIRLEVTGLEPGVHGFHIHATGACEAPGFTSAGGHFAPRDNAHGFRSPGGGHAGDLPNLHVGTDGNATTERRAADVTLRTGPLHSLFDADGSAVVLHGGADDYASQPSGAAGPRVACGVIRR